MFLKFFTIENNVCFGFIVQFSSVAQSCPTLCDPMHCSMPGFPAITNSQTLLTLMSIELVMPSNHLILCCPVSSHLQSFPASGSFQMSQFRYMIYGLYYVDVISIYVHFLKSWSYMGAEFCQKLFLRLLSFLSVSICFMYWGASVLGA